MLQPEPDAGGEFAARKAAEAERDQLQAKLAKLADEAAVGQATANQRILTAAQELNHVQARMTELEDEKQNILQQAEEHRQQLQKQAEEFQHFQAHIAKVEGEKQKKIATGRRPQAAAAETSRRAPSLPG